MPPTTLRRRVTAEFVGTLFLVSTVIGSGIMAERLAGTNVALALLANTVAAGAILVALIFTFGAISGAHFNPAVTVADAMEHGMPWREVPSYVAAQCSGGLVGAMVAHLMFGCRSFPCRATREAAVVKWSANSSPHSGFSRSSGAVHEFEPIACRLRSDPTSRLRTGSHPQHRSRTRQ